MTHRQDHKPDSVIAMRRAMAHLNTAIAAFAGGFSSRPWHVAAKIERSVRNARAHVAEAVIAAEAELTSREGL